MEDCYFKKILFQICPTLKRNFLRILEIHPNFLSSTHFKNFDKLRVFVEFSKELYLAFPPNTDQKKRICKV